MLMLSDYKTKESTWT